MSLRQIQLTVESRPLGTAHTWSYPNSDGNIYVVPTYHLTVDGRTGAGVPVRRRFEVLRFGVHRTVATPAPHIVGISAHHRYVIRRWIPTYKVHSFPSREDGAWQVHGNYLIHDGPDDPKTQLYATAGCIEICGGPNGFVAFNDHIIALSGSAKGTTAKKLAEIGASGCMTITYTPATLPPVQLR